MMANELNVGPVHIVGWSSQFIVIAKGRHLAPGQDPVAFNAALLAFLAKH